MGDDFLNSIKELSRGVDERIAAAALLSALHGRRCHAMLIERLGILSHPSIRKFRKQIENLSESFCESFSKKFHLKVSLREEVVSARNLLRKKTNDEENFQLKVSSESFCETFSEKPKRKKVKKRDSDEEVAHRRELFKVYSDERAKRWNGAVPADSKKLRSQIKTFSQTLPKDVQLEVIKFYCNHHSKRYVDQMHDFGLLLFDVQKVFGEWQTGIHITAKKSQEVELLSHNRLVGEEWLRNKQQGKDGTYGVG